MARETEAQTAEAVCLMSPVSTGQSTVETPSELVWWAGLPGLSLSPPEGGWYLRRSKCVCVSPLTDGMSQQLSCASEQSHLPASGLAVPHCLQRGTLKAAALRLSKLLNGFFKVLLSPVKELWWAGSLFISSWHCSLGTACLPSSWDRWLLAFTSGYSSSEVSHLLPF